ncbi:MAG TPA: TonB-dependent receptor [Cellvibrio sp.]|nr:TonB-dependent receptor [Cellvibrio sp.]
MPKDRSIPQLISSVTPLSLALLTTPATALASADYFELSLEQLLEVKVHSVSKKEESVANAPAAVHVVTSEDIIRSGVTNIPDALRMVPGVEVARSDSNSWAISIRGFNSALANKLLVMIDGRTIYNPVFGGTLWEAHDLMLEDIERIEVIRGPGGALWGANAVNGVINIITKHTRATPGTLTSAIYGTEEQSLGARHGGALGNNGSYRVYAKGFNQEPSRKPQSAETDEQQDTYDEWDGFRTGFRADWADEFTLQGDAYRVDAEQLRPHFSLTAPFAPIEQQLLRYQGINLLGRWTDKHSDGSQLSLQTYIDWAKRDEPINFIDDRITYDLEAQYDFAPLGAHVLIAGAGFRFLSDDEQGDNNVSFDPQRARTSLYSAFAQDKITLAPERWFLTLGAKWEHNEFSGAEFQPNVRLQWQPDPDKTLWSSISHAVRTPTRMEEDMTSTLATASGFRAAFVPNDAFKSEELVSYELGYRQQLASGLSLDLAAFYNEYEHLGTTAAIPAEISLVNNGTDPLHFLIPYIFTNEMHGTTDGLEAAINWSIQPDLKLSATYSYLNMALEALDPGQEYPEKLSPEHQAGLSLFWNITDYWTLDTTATWVDELPATQVDDYLRLDINLGAQISKSVRFNLVGQNLAESAHREFGSANDLNAGEIERSILAKLTWEL